MKYSPTAEPGSRISEITDLDGNKIDYEQIYTVAITEGSVSEEYIRSCDKTGVLISDLLENSIHDKKIITSSGDMRFHIF